MPSPLNCFRGVEAAEFEDQLGVGLVFVETFLDDGAEVFPEILILVVGLRFFGEVTQHALGEAGFDFAEDRVVLQHFAADVQRQIFAIHDAAHEPQVRGQEALGHFGDEDAFDVELHMAAALGVEDIERFGGGYEEKGAVIERAFGVPVEVEPRIIERVAGVVVDSLYCSGVMSLGDLSQRAEALLRVRSNSPGITMGNEM